MDHVERLNAVMGKTVRTTRPIKSLHKMDVPVGSKAKVVGRIRNLYSLCAVPGGLHFFCTGVKPDSFEVVE